eukprot:snap_masked-scaffold_3-processed-gene-12.27-mRNA-1 protein AED:0.01 eAED:0.01 QI:0/-1/0/1/-1/1/1/0/560
MKEKESVKVFIRIKPNTERKKIFKIHDIEENILVVNRKGEKKGFEYTGILDEETEQEEVFKILAIPCIESLLEGFNSTIFAYGQTGSGKTYSITGGTERYCKRGIIPRVLSRIYKKLEEESTIRISYLEIYNEIGFDLLSDTLNRVNSLEDENGNLHFVNLRTIVAPSEEKALDLLFQGDTNRAVCETTMNATSSRSHCIFSIMVHTTKEELVTISKLNIVDLAGNERVSKTNAQGRVLNEAKYINSSLHFLEMVILALQEAQESEEPEEYHIPYRNSFLTQVLRDSLGGNSKTVMLATISGDEKFIEESISTLRFAERVRKIKNFARKNIEIDPFVIIEKLKKQLTGLKQENKFYQEELARLEGREIETEEYEEEEVKVMLKEKIFNWIQSPTYFDFEFKKYSFSFSNVRICFQILWKFFKQQKPYITEKDKQVSMKKKENDNINNNVYLDTSKLELKKKIEIAKVVGEETKTLRNKMFEIKTIVEKIRLQREVFNSNIVNETKEQLNETNNVLDEREDEAVKRIRKYKAKYQIRLEKLSNLKKEIEHLQRVIKAKCIP